MTKPLEDMTEVDARVLKGVLFLDAHVPDWRANVRKNRLRTSDPYKCIVGQWLAPFSLSYREFADWLDEAIGEYPAYRWRYEHGFASPIEKHDQAAMYDALDRAWQRWL